LHTGIIAVVIIYICSLPPPVINKVAGEIGPNEIGPYKIGPSNRTYKIGPYKIGPL
jgi:hypothetical protein